MGNIFDLGVVIGRFQTFHKGHKQIIETACSMCNRVGVLVGSAQEFGTFKNPFTFEKRKQVLQEICGPKLEIYPLKDIGVGNTSEWGEYVIQKIVEYFGKRPDVLISGKEERRTNWFEGEIGDGIAEVFLPKTIEISATTLRNYLINDEREKWEKYVPEEMHMEYTVMRQLMLAARDNIFSASV